jgi:hypothetical protein
MTSRAGRLHRIDLYHAAELVNLHLNLEFKLRSDGRANFGGKIRPGFKKGVRCYKYRSGGVLWLALGRPALLWL